MTRILLKIIALKSKNNKTPQGFTSLEILVALIISLAFVGLSLQAIVTGMMLKVEAQKEQRADQLIQEDIERINDLAANLAFNINTCNATTYNNGYAKSLWTALAYPDTTTTNISGDDVMAVSITPISKSISGNTVSPSETGIKLGLEVDEVSDGNANTKTLQIRYQVKEWDYIDISGNDRVKWEKDTNGNQIILAERYIEMIPDVALECP